MLQEVLQTQLDGRGKSVSCTEKHQLCRVSRDGSDGTRTRDLRRDGSAVIACCDPSLLGRRAPVARQ